MSTPGESGGVEGQSAGSRGGLTPLSIVIGTVLIDLIGFGIVLPLLPLWAEEFGASPTQVGALAATYALAQVIAAPLWGMASDRVGRRPVLLVSLAGASVGAFLTGFAGSLWLLFLARALHGASGASYVAAQAYVADVTSPERRARGMGLIGAAFGVGFVIGPAIGAGLALIDLRAPFIFAGVLAALGFLVALRFLPESRPVTVRMQEAATRTARRLPREAYGILAVAFVATAAFVGVEAIFALFVERQLGYGPVAIALVFVYIGVAAVISQGLLVGPVARRWGEARMLVGGLVGTGLGMLAVGLSDELWQLLPALLLMALAWGFVYAGISTLITFQAGDHAQGGTLGVLGSASGLARVVGPLGAGFALGALGAPAPLLIGAALLGLCVLAAPLALSRTTTNLVAPASR